MSKISTENFVEYLRERIAELKEYTARYEAVLSFEEFSANGQPHEIEAAEEPSEAVKAEIRAAVDSEPAPVKKPYAYKKNTKQWSRKKKKGVAQIASRPMPVREIAGTNSSNLRRLLATYSGLWFTLDEIVELEAKHGITIPRGQLHPFLHEERRKGRLAKRITDGKPEFTSLIGGTATGKVAVPEENQAEAS